jgi:hypothetical protein
MTVLGTKTVHIIEGAGAAHPGMYDILPSSCKDLVDDSREGIFKPNNTM